MATKTATGTILTVKKMYARKSHAKKEGKGLAVSWPANHPRSDSIDKWLKNVSPGYVEYMLQTGDEHGPHCNACQDYACEANGLGDDACPAFRIGRFW